MRVYTVLFVLLFLSTPLVAQETTSEVPFIEVEGNAKREIVPNQIFVSVELREKTIGKKYLTLAEQEVKFNEIIDRLNVDRSKISLVNAVSSIIQRRDRDKGVVRTKVYNVELSTAQQVSDLFSQLNANGIRETDIVRLDHTDIIDIRKEVRIEAIKAAKTKAEYLTAAIGHSVGTPLIIREAQNIRGINQSPYSNVVVRGYAAAEEGISGVDFEKIQVSFSYYIKYEIKSN